MAQMGETNHKEYFLWPFHTYLGGDFYCFWGSTYLPSPPPFAKSHLGRRQIANEWMSLGIPNPIRYIRIDRTNNETEDLYSRALYGLEAD